MFHDISGMTRALGQLTDIYKHLAKKQRLVLISASAFVVFVLVAFFFSWGGQHYVDPRGNIQSSDPIPHQHVYPTDVHPIDYLISHARSSLAEVKSRQSTTLDEAVHEYERRYGISPPPNFDKWYDFAVKNDVQLIDEYDTIHDLLLPFWAFSPFALRQKVRKALRGDDFVLGVFVRDGTVTSTDRGPEWRGAAIRDTIQVFAEFLPDMDMVFNIHDEPRVVVPYGDLARILDRARFSRQSMLRKTTTPRNAWSSPPTGLSDGTVEIDVFKPFNRWAHQFTWLVSSSSCPPDSRARSLQFDGVPIADDDSAYVSSPLNFVRNQTAMTNICQSPSLEHTYSIFNKPNAWSVAHELFPLFSPSKVSSFQDILYPAPWYLAEKVAINDEIDKLWDDKKDLLYWRGTTTSGYSEDGVWRRQNRQRFVMQAEQPGHAQILHRESGPNSPWQVKDIDRTSLQHLYNVHFTFIGQCSEEDCEVQRNYFDVYEDEDFQNATLYKYLLDLDGNAFSGRFYAFLGSHSLTLKLALFREWHEERITPWVHYIPLNVNGSDHMEIMRYLTAEEDGKRLGREIAGESRDWAKRTLRQVDMQAWMFRLLLEYGRLVDDHRDEIGFKL